MKEQNNHYHEDDFKELEHHQAARRMSSDKQPLEGIRLRFKVAKKQDLSQGGMALSIILINDSPEDITISNPLDSIQIVLEDKDGWPVKLPAIGPPRVLINTRGVPADIIRPFNVQDIVNSLNEPDLMKHEKDEKFILKKKTSYEFKILIDEVQAGDKKAWKEHTSETKPIEKGKYKVKIQYQLLLSNDSPVHRQNESWYMEVELV